MTEELGFWEAFFESDAVMVIAIGLVLGAGDKIFELFIEIRDWFNPLAVVDQFESGVVLRWGKYTRTVGPGLHFIWPCGVEEVLTDTVVRTTSYLDVQSLTTRDNETVNIGLILVYKIGNIKRWLLEVDDAEDALHDIAYGIAEELVSVTRKDDIHSPTFAEELTDRVREAGVTWGARIEAVKFSDKVRGKSLRLWMGTE